MNNRGSILIVVMWVVLILSMIVAGISVQAGIEAHIARFFYDTMYERYYARSGITAGLFLLENDDDTSVDSVYDTWYNPSSIEEIGLPDEFKKLSVTIIDEESKININAASDVVFKALCENIAKNNEVFIESDIEKLAEDIGSFRGNGAQIGVKTLKEKVSVRPFAFLEEMQSIEQVKENDFKVFEKYFTVYPSNDSLLKVNINTAADVVIQSVLEGVVSDATTRATLLNAVVDYRKGNEETNQQYFIQDDISVYRFLNVLELSRDVKLISLVVQFLRNVTVDSRYFAITSRMNEKPYTVKAIVSQNENNGTANNTEEVFTIMRWVER